MAMLNNQMVIHQVMIQRAAMGPLPDMAMRCYGLPNLGTRTKIAGIYGCFIPSKDGHKKSSTAFLHLFALNSGMFTLGNVC